MAKKVVRVPAFTGDELLRGEKMKPGKGWRLTGPNKRAFKATLVKRFDSGDENVAIFRVVKTQRASNSN